MLEHSMSYDQWRRDKGINWNLSLDEWGPNSNVQITCYKSRLRWRVKRVEADKWVRAAQKGWSEFRSNVQ